MGRLFPKFDRHQYWLTVMAVLFGLIGLKLVITWLAEAFLYPLPFLGGWLKSLEIIEFINIPLFALLGLGLGAACQWLPAKTPLPAKALALVLSLPLLFFSSYALRYHLWLHRLTAEADLPRQEVRAMADIALQRESGHRGFWGYYITTTSMPILPQSGAELQRMTEDQKWFRSELTHFSGIEPGVFSLVFNGAGWGIRLFYMGLAFITGTIYFLKGLAWVHAQRLHRLVQTKP
ncbi:MAG: hypothetical protein VKO01_06450 [Cyanobacteriota bacterium]|jgi:hypothetical protein|nr:hypothetical protein [Cyanobacteriota bacterium]